MVGKKNRKSKMIHNLHYKFQKEFPRSKSGFKAASTGTSVGDPGSGASAIRNRFVPGPGSRTPNPYFLQLKDKSRI
jgi:hypothetical protein